MTNEQHIENLKKLKSFHNGSYGASVNAAINALEHEQALGEAFNIALLYGKEKGMEAIDKALYQMGMDGIKEQEIEALEQEPILDEIRAEIDRQYKWLINTRYTIRDVDIAFGSIFRIIDKYKVESEDKHISGKENN